LIGLGRFSKNKQTNVIWVGYSDGGQLSILVNKISIALSELGFEPETRPFNAHLTLGRVNKRINEENLETLIEINQKKIFQNFKINAVNLFESILKPAGSIYKIIKQIHF
jgi:RNA 2',3'-cyclic 3'-phosphodiesterase